MKHTQTHTEIRPFVTNSLPLSIKQEETATSIAQLWFESNHTDDFWHFSFEGTHLNLNTGTWAASWEVHGATGSFVLVCDLHSSKKLDLRTIRLIQI